MFRILSSLVHLSVFATITRSVENFSEIKSAQRFSASFSANQKKFQEIIIRVLHYSF